ncbi:MAG: phosphate signaling complex protein PhoU [Actinobacteria bacterium]|nr:phosphate signaling complex protein PhoU [Actinomycetota bacterium]MBW3641482.1 phosphate signaling complex protein PhoU [Actinomycetota bacterium]
MSMAAEPGGGHQLRSGFAAELEQLRLQVEVMTVRVGEALERMSVVLRTADRVVAEAALAADDDVDAMLVSLTERCYDLIRREAPVASDLRFLVSVLRVLEELERIGDLSLRVVKQAPELYLVTGHPAMFRTLLDMADVAQALYRTAVDAWSSQDPALAQTLADRNRVMDGHYAALLDHILGLDGPRAAQLAVVSVLVGRALERIADHTVIIGERLRYLLTGDPAHLAAEVR